MVYGFILLTYWFFFHFFLGDVGYFGLWVKVFTDSFFFFFKSVSLFFMSSNTTNSNSGEDIVSEMRETFCFEREKKVYIKSYIHLWKSVQSVQQKAHCCANEGLSFFPGERRSLEKQKAQKFYPVSPVKSVSYPRSNCWPMFTIISSRTVSFTSWSVMYVVSSNAAIAHFTNRIVLSFHLHVNNRNCPFLAWISFQIPNFTTKIYCHNKYCVFGSTF